MGFVTKKYQRPHDRDVDNAYSKLMKAEVDLEKCRASTELWFYVSKAMADERAQALADARAAKNGERPAAGTIACVSDDIKLTGQDIAEIREVMYRVFKRHIDLNDRDLKDDEEEVQK